MTAKTRRCYLDTYLPPCFESEFKPVLFITADKLRTLCMDKGYYTLGDSRSYCILLKVFDEVPLDMEALTAMAIDIRLHSVPEVCEDYLEIIRNIMHYSYLTLK